MNSKIKNFFAGAVTATLIFSLASGALAAQVKKAAELIYDGYKIVIDGKEITPKDATGAVVEPFNYNGTIYLPVRAVGEALGKEVSFDAASKTVKLAAPAPKGEFMGEVLKNFEQHDWWPGIGEDETIKMAGDEYRHSIKFEGTKPMWYQDHDHAASWNLKGKYKTIRGTFGRIDGSDAGIGTITITLDGKEYKTYEITKLTLPFDVVLDVTGCNILTISYKGDCTSIGFGSVIIE